MRIVLYRGHAVTSAAATERGCDRVRERTQVTHDQKVPSVVFGALTDDHRENVQRAWVVVAPLVGGMQARTSPSTSLSFRSLRAEYFQNGHPEILGRPRVKHWLTLSGPGDPARTVHVPDAPAGKLFLKLCLGLIKFR